MQLAMIGLGRMGANMVRRLIKGGHECVVFDMSPKAVAAGADVLVAGSAIFNGSEGVTAAMQRLRAALQL